MNAYVPSADLRCVLKPCSPPRPSLSPDKTASTAHIAFAYASYTPSSIPPRRKALEHQSIAGQLDLERQTGRRKRNPDRLWLLEAILAMGMEAFVAS